MNTPKDKSTGTVYTPSQIATFMAEISLSALSVTSANKALQILDPAVGEGVFPIALQEQLSNHQPHHVYACDINPDALKKTRTAWDNEASSQTAASQLHLFHDSFFNLHNQVHVPAFDLIIGNPPYLKEYTHRSSFENLPYYQGKMDLWYAFACQSFDLLKPGGILCFIATNNWTTNKGASLFREKIRQEMRILKLIDFGACKVFLNASVHSKSAGSSKAQFSSITP